ncbi:hypothetical protein QYM36_007480, partial [Artemia franciscana]
KMSVVENNDDSLSYLGRYLNVCISTIAKQSGYGKTEDYSKIYFMDRYLEVVNDTSPGIKAQKMLTLLQIISDGIRSGI